MIGDADLERFNMARIGDLLRQAASGAEYLRLAFPSPAALPKPVTEQTLQALRGTREDAAWALSYARNELLKTPMSESAKASVERDTNRLRDVERELKSAEDALRTGTTQNLGDFPELVLARTSSQLTRSLQLSQQSKVPACRASVGVAVENALSELRAKRFLRAKYWIDQAIYDDLECEEDEAEAEQRYS